MLCTPEINKDLAFATMASDLTPAFGALALAAVFSAEASAADAVLFMLATSGSRDLYRRLRPGATDKELLRAARTSAIAGALLGLGLAMMHQSVIAALGTFYAVMVVTLFVPLLAGLYAPRTSRRQGLASLAGVPVLAVVYFATDGAGYGALTPVVSGVLASAVAFWATEQTQGLSTRRACGFLSALFNARGSPTCIRVLGAPPPSAAARAFALTAAARLSLALARRLRSRARGRGRLSMYPGTTLTTASAYLSS